MGHFEIVENNLKRCANLILPYIAGLILIAILLFVPYSNQLAVAFRKDFLSILIIIFAAYLILSLFHGLAAELSIFCIIAFLMGISVVGLWGTGQSEQYVIGGIIPFSDARFYYMDARRLLEGYLFRTGAARRPIFAALFSTIQWATSQNLYISIFFLVVLVTFAIYFAVRELHSSDSPVAAGFFLVLCFLYFRFLMGKTMSEMAGFPLGLMAFFFLYRSSKSEKLTHFLSGLFLLTLALVSRAGAFFILPLLVLWAGYTFRKQKKFNWIAILASIAVIVIGFAINTLLFNFLSNPDSTPFGNFSFTLYGIARGGQSWTLIYEEHPEINNMPGEVIFNYVYQLSFDNIRNNPGEFFTGILNSYKLFFSLDDYYGSLCWFGGSNLVGNIARLVLYILMAIGLYGTISKIKKSDQSLFLAAFIGIVVSISFLPPRDSNHMRVYAATLPFFIAMPMTGISFLNEKVKFRKEIFPKMTERSASFPAIFSAVIIVLMTVVPVSLYFSSKKPVIPKTQCSSELTPISFRLLPGNHIILHDPGEIKQNWVPDLKKDDFRRLVHDLPNWELIPILSKTDANHMIISDLDLITMREMILITNVESVKNSTEIQTICGTYQTDPDLKVYNVYVSD